MPTDLTIAHCPWVSDDWYAVEPRFGASVEGHADEWREIANAILSGADASFTRCAAKVGKREVELWSPRNSVRRQRLSRTDAKAFALRVLAVLDPHRDAPVRRETNDDNLLPEGVPDV